MAIDQTRANEVLTWMHGGAAPAAISGSRLRLYTASGTATTEGTQVASGGSYVGGNAATTGIALTWSAPSAASQATSAVAQQTNMPAASVSHVEVWSADATPKRVEYGAITGGAKAVSAGDTLSFAAGAITSAFS